MPYDENNPPAFAKNLPKGAIKVCVDAFNAVMRDSGDEEQARQACWANVKRDYKKVGDKWMPMSDKKKLAEWDTKYINDLPDAAFAFIESGGKKDADGKTEPRGLRHLPHHTMDCTSPTDNKSVDKPHLRNALARVDQTKIDPEAKAKAKAHLQAHAKALGIGMMSELLAFPSTFTFEGEGGNIFTKELIKVGSWFYEGAPDNTFKVSKDKLQEMIDNFKSYWKEVPVPYGIPHADSEYAGDVTNNVGWVKDMWLDGNSLMGKVEILDPEVAQKIGAGLIKNSSVMVDLEKVSNDSGEPIGAVIEHLLLTNRPLIKDLKPFGLSDGNKKEVIIMHRSIMKKKTEKKEKTNKKVSLSEKVKELKVKLSEAEKQLKSKKSLKIKLGAASKIASTLRTRVVALEEKQRSDEADKTFKAYLEEGKVLPAQESVAKTLLSRPEKIKLSDGKEKSVKALFSEFLSKQPKFELGEKGTMATEHSDDKFALSEDERKFIKKQGISLRDYYVYGLGIDKAEVKKHLKK